MSTETARLILGTRLKDADEIAYDLASILEKHHIRVHVHGHVLGNGHGHVVGKEKKDKAPSEIEEGDKYTITIINEQAVPQFPVIYFADVSINSVDTLLNTWYTYPNPISHKGSAPITWIETYSITLSRIPVTEGAIIKETISHRTSLGIQLNFTMNNGAPILTSTAGIIDKSIIQVFFEPIPNVSYEDWAIGFGLADPDDKDNPVKVVQADANLVYKFQPHIKSRFYKVGLTPTNQSNMLLKESDVTYLPTIQFRNFDHVTATYKVDGSWQIEHPSVSQVTTQ